MVPSFGAASPSLMRAPPLAPPLLLTLAGQRRRRLAW